MKFILAFEKKVHRLTTEVNIFFYFYISKNIHTVEEIITDIHQEHDKLFLVIL